MEKRIENEQGQSLLGAMVGLGLASLMMVILADAAVWSAKSQRTVTIQMDFDSLSETMRRTVAYEPTCTPSLSGQPYTQDLGMRDPLDINHFMAASNLKREVGLTLSHISLRDVLPVESKPGFYRGNLYVEGRKDMKVALGAPVLMRKIGEVYFEAGSDGIIKRCYGTESLDTTAETNCKMLGGKWNGSGGEGKHCTLVASNDQPGVAPENNGHDPQGNAYAYGHDKQEERASAPDSTSTTPASSSTTPSTDSTGSIVTTGTVSMVSSDGNDSSNNGSKK